MANCWLIHLYFPICQEILVNNDIWKSECWLIKIWYWYLQMHFFLCMVSVTVKRILDCSGASIMLLLFQKENEK